MVHDAHCPPGHLVCLQWRILDFCRQFSNTIELLILFHLWCSVLGCMSWCGLTTVLQKLQLSLRNMLMDLGYFAPKESSVTIKLAEAYKCFKAWCSANRVSCSQPPFTEGLVTCFQGIRFCLQSIDSGFDHVVVLVRDVP